MNLSAEKDSVVQGLCKNATCENFTSYLLMNHSLFNNFVKCKQVPVMI
jgi:hypothetical protein